MKITRLHPRGIPKPERHGIAAFEKHLPADWFGYSNLLMCRRNKAPREIDVVIVTHDRIIIADLKHWHGRVESQNEYWFHNRTRSSWSAVRKINENAKELADFLKVSCPNLPAIPSVEEYVIFTEPTVDLTGITPNEQLKIFKLEQFLKIRSDAEYSSRLVRQPWSRFSKSNPLYKHEQALDEFFIGKGHFRAQEARFANYSAERPEWHFEHPGKLYAEYKCTRDGDRNFTALLRLWNFEQRDADLSVSEIRAPIARREQHALGYIKHRIPDKGLFLIPLVTEDDSDTTLRYWELYELPPDFERLGEFINQHAGLLSTVDRLNLASVLLGHVADLHRIRVAHRDIASHSIWLQLPSRVSLSGFIAAHFPNTESLGDRRALVVAGRQKLPEDIQPDLPTTPFAQDVFLLGAALWHLATGDPLERQGDGTPKLAEGADPFELGAAGRAWLAKALARAPKDRFGDAIEMRDAFHALREKAAPRSDDFSFARFERDIEVLFDFPNKGRLKKGRSRVYLSELHGQPIVVKHWPMRVLGDRWRSSPRVHAFLETAEELRLVPSPHVAEILDLGIDRDGLFLLQKHYDAPTLAEADLIQWSSRQALTYMFALADAVVGLHDRKIHHGDLKPDQVLASAGKDSPTPILLDLPEFSSEADGDVTNTAFATAPDLTLDKASRDRFAVCRLIEHICSRLAPDTIDAAAMNRIQAAIESCHKADPPYLTIDPVKQTLSDLLHVRVVPAPRSIQVRLRSRASIEVMHSDNGVFHVSVRPAKDDRPPRLRVAGADELLELTVNLQTRRFDRVSLKAATTYDVARTANYAAHSFAATIALEPGKGDDGTALEWLLTEPSIVEKLERGAPDESKVEELEPSEDDDADDAEPPVGPVDLETLWSSLISTEEEALPEVTVSRPSAIDRGRNLHLVPIDPGSTTLDFDPTETVYVGAVLPTGRSHPIGELDLGATTPDTLAITWHREHRTFFAGARLRLHGHSDRASFTRRKRGIERITAHHSVIRDLIEYFDARLQKAAIKVADPPDPEILKSYDLDESQTTAFVHLWTHGPVGLLQGPPGTGKTTFIAAFVDYALTHGKLKNVLLVSQSHEGVNNAMEKIVKRLRPGDRGYSMIRIGQKGHVSPLLRPYHSEAIQESYREIMHATLKERIRIIGRQLGLPPTYVAEAFELDARIGQFARAIAVAQQEFDESEDEKSAAFRQLEGLKQSFASVVRSDGYDGDPSPLLALDALHARLSEKHRVGNLDAVSKLRRTFGLAREYLSALASRHHNLEEFLGRSRNLVCGTCVGIGRTALKIEDNMFDLVVIDEASRANAGELSVAMQVGRRVLLVGDHKQLPPQFERTLIDEVTTRHGPSYGAALRQSEFQRAFSTSYGQFVGRTLTRQYRMEPPIGSLISKFFYTGKLENAKKDPTPDWYSALPNCLSACVTWLDTASLGGRANEREGTKERTSRENLGETEVIVALLRQIAACDGFVENLRANAKKDEAPIGILTMYKAQAILLRDRIAGEEWPEGFQGLLKIATVDGYQGKENPIVIVSLVRNNLKRDAGHVRKPNRVNVALSRAQERLVLVGSTHMWSSRKASNHLRRILDFIRDKAGDSSYAVVDAKRVIKA